jgi:hypothetical protein
LSRARRLGLALVGVLSLVVVAISVRTRDWLPALGTLMLVASVVVTLRKEKDQAEPARPGAKSGFFAVLVILLIALGFVGGWIWGELPD